MSSNQIETFQCIPPNTRRWANIGSVLAKRRRRLANTDSTLGQRLVSGGIVQIES